MDFQAKEKLCGEDLQLFSFFCCKLSNFWFDKTENMTTLWLFCRIKNPQIDNENVALSLSLSLSPNKQTHTHTHTHKYSPITQVIDSHHTTFEEWLNDFLTSCNLTQLCKHAVTYTHTHTHKNTQGTSGEGRRQWMLGVVWALRLALAS